MRSNNERRQGRLAPRPATKTAVLALLVALAWLGPAAAAEETGDLVRLWVEVTDDKGRTPAELGAGDLEVLEGGVSRPVAALGQSLAASGADARVVLYFDQALAGSRTIKVGAESLSDLARQLTGLGEVEIVTAAADADAGPETELRSRDPLIVGQHLARAALTDTGEERLLEIRRRALRDLLGTAARAPSPEEAARVVEQAIDEEIELLRQRREELVAWAFETAGRDAAAQGMRILVWMTDGFDLDPLDFYARHLDGEATRAAAGRAARRSSLDDEARELARTLAAAGWTVLPVSFPAAGEVEGIEYTAIESEDETGATGDDGMTSGAGITLRPGSLFRRRDEEAAAKDIPAAELVDPLAPLRRLADETGGDLVRSGTGLRDALERFAARVEVAYRSALPASGRSLRLEVRPRPAGWRVKSRLWIAGGVPEAVAAVRLRRLLAGFEGGGGFDVAAVLRLDEPSAAEDDDAAPSAGQLELRLNLRELEAAAPGEEQAELASANLRVSVAVASAEGELTITSEILAGQDLRGRGEWTWRSEIELPAGAEEVAVIVEDLHRGHWGGRRATVVRGDWAAAEDVLPTPAVIEIRRPDKELLRGRVRFETEVYDPHVAAVEFLLDDREVARRSEPPYAARIDLGRTPRRRDLTVVAYDGAGAEVGRDSVVVNGGSGGLAVDIVRPESFRGTGAVEVEAEVAVPLERRLDRVLFFWNNEPVATVYGAPFRQRIYIPPERPAGYVRVVAMLDDGTTAEDVAFMNGPAASDRLDVNLVELYVVVTDADGRPVRGLTAESFRVREDGKPQQIATFSDASDLPLTLGMAIDSSASMFVKLPRIQRAAIDFLHSTFSAQDRAFVVDFDTEPRLARATTASLDRLERSIFNLEADGRTALWESIVFSLVQLQGVRGRKALIVFSDGADEDDQFPFRSSLDIAKRMGVPIYLILMKREPRESAGLSLFTRSFTSRTNRLVEATGGRVFYAKEYDHLDEVYEEIEQELRSQYLLAYYPNETSSRAWRNVDVEVDGRGLVPRTLSGYWQ